MGLGVCLREKSFGQRLKFGAGGGKFVPLGPRTIFLGCPKRIIDLSIIRMNHFFLQIASFSQKMLSASQMMGVLFNGIAGPMVEELYFRGYLLPRISRLKGWAPLLNVFLFSVYHFFTPWRNLERILALLPGIYIIQWKKNIYLGMIPHCLLNATGMLLMTPLLFK